MSPRRSACSGCSDVLAGTWAARLPPLFLHPQPFLAAPQGVSFPPAQCRRGPRGGGQRLPPSAGLPAGSRACLRPGSGARGVGGAPRRSPPLCAAAAAAMSPLRWLRWGSWLLLLAGPAAPAASPADEGGRREPGAGEPGSGDEAPRQPHDSSYGTFAGEFYDLRYLSEEGERPRRALQHSGRGAPGQRRLLRSAAACPRDHRLPTPTPGTSLRDPSPAPPPRESLARSFPTPHRRSFPNKPPKGVACEMLSQPPMAVRHGHLLSPWPVWGEKCLGPRCDVWGARGVHTQLGGCREFAPIRLS